MCDSDARTIVEPCSVFAAGSGHAEMAAPRVVRAFSLRRRLALDPAPVGIDPLDALRALNVDRVPSLQR
jgi:hypothetical protein